MQSVQRTLRHLVVVLGLAAGFLSAASSSLHSAEPAKAAAEQSVDLKDAKQVAAEVDRLILADLKKSKTPIAPLTGEEDFLRRVMLDLTGTVPSPRDIVLFGLDPDSQKRTKLIDHLVKSDSFAENWGRYWRDVIYSRATDMRSRLYQQYFEQWMTAQLKQNKNWAEITKSMLTSTGDVRENGATALMFAQGGNAKELASETSRIFLGIQIQCANCHDHPSDKWKREQFHQLAAFFPRVRIRPKRTATPRSFEVASFDVSTNAGRGGSFFGNPEQLLRRFDKNNDKKISRQEVKNSSLAQFFSRLLARVDTDEDQKLSLAELKKIRTPAGSRRGTSEHFMSNLADPNSRGTRIDPVFFVNGSKPATGLKDLQRRSTLAEYVTSADNPWFARAFVNRIWAEMHGEGFSMPIDDMGPERITRYPEVLDLLSRGFTENNYHIQWLFRTIANSETYQREIRANDPSKKTPAFASATPTRLRADQLYNSVTNALGVSQLSRRPSRGRGQFGYNASARRQFSALFGFDPSTPQDAVVGTIPQALFLMNSPVLNNLIRAEGNTRLAKILEQFSDDTDALSELYLHVLGREPSEKELKICLEYLADVKNRKEAFEDLMWSLLNSSEFRSRR